MDEELEVGLKELEILKLNEKAENAVAVAAAAAAATGAVPIPFADAPLLIGEQVALMATICGIYGINVSKDGLKMLATAAIGTGGATLVGKTLATNLIKLIPGAGSVVGGAISAGTAGVVTLAMGKAFIKVCNLVKVGKLSEADLTSKKGKDALAEQFKKQVKSVKKENKSDDKKAKKSVSTKMLNIPNEYSTSSVNQPKGFKLPDGVTPYGLRTEGTSALLTHMYVEESASMPFNDDQSIIDSLHNALDESMGIVEVGHGVTSKGKPYVFDVIKQPRVENGKYAEHGVGYTLNLNVKDGDVIHYINGSFQEEGTTGMRDSVVMMMYIKENELTPSEAQKTWFKDPYDESFTKGFLRNYSEQEKFDGMFPDHPLTHLHQFVKYVADNN